MIKNYLTVSFRNLTKNKFYLFINVVGLGLALATCIVAYLNSEFALNFDGQHVNSDKIYKVHLFYQAHPYLPHIGLDGHLGLKLNSKHHFGYEYFNSRRFSNFVETADLFLEG